MRYYLILHGIIFDPEKTTRWILAGLVPYEPEHEALQFDTKNGRLLFWKRKLFQIFNVHSQREHTLVVLYACSYIICLLLFTCLFFLVCLLFTGPTVVVFRSPHTRTMPQAMSLPWTHSDIDLESGHPLPSNRPHPLVRYLWSERLADQPAVNRHTLVMM